MHSCMAHLWQLADIRLSLLFLCLDSWRSLSWPVGMLRCGWGSSWLRHVTLCMASSVMQPLQSMILALN